MAGLLGAGLVVMNEDEVVVVGLADVVVWGCGVFGRLVEVVVLG
ncbi:MAG: hypothetical protein AB7E49_10790 [Campylobacterales bacterium]